MEQYEMQEILNKALPYFNAKKDYMCHVLYNNTEFLPCTYACAEIEQWIEELLNDYPDVGGADNIHSILRDVVEYRGGGWLPFEDTAGVRLAIFQDWENRKEVVARFLRGQT